MTSPVDKQEMRRRRGEDRQQRIVDAARGLASAEGWPAVTTRRLADAIGYTQPVLYGHFPGGKVEIMSAVALEGFTELSRSCTDALGRRTGRDAVESVARAYLDFAAAHPAVYAAMFALPIEAHFAVDDNEPELQAGFAALARALRAAGGADDGTATEVFWGALHGIGELERAGRMRPEHRAQRIAELGTRFSAAP